MGIPHIELGRIAESLVGQIDLFICSASFEERSCSIAKNIDVRRIKKVLIAENENHSELHGKIPSSLKRIFGNKSEMVMLDTTNPLKTEDNLRLALFTFFSESSLKRIVVDITTFTHESLLILLNLLKSQLRACNVECLYLNAEEYSLGDEGQDKWLSKGVGEVRSVIGFPGEFAPSRKLHLIMLVGFEHDRAAELIRRYEPSIISLGYGQTTEEGAERHSGLNKQRFEMVKAIHGYAQEFSFSCYDPLMTKKTIETQISRAPGFNVIIAPMNTKLSTVGTALVAFANESIQLCYAQAHSYNYEHYSKPGSFVYRFDLPV